MKSNNTSLLNFMFGESRSGGYHPSKTPPQWIVQGNYTKAGMQVTEESVKGIAAVYACVKVLAESVASLPLVLYRRLPNGGKERATKHPLYYVLHDQPNQFMTSVEWRETLMWHLCLRGNSYCQILLDNGQRVKELIPLDPNLVTPYLNEKQELRYKYNPLTGEGKDFSKEKILHIKGLSTNGLVGESPLTVARETFGMALAVQTHGAKSYSNGAALRGVLTLPGHMEDEERIEAFRKQWKELYNGSDKTSETAILEDGMTFKEISMNMRDAQFVEMLKLSIEEVARLFRVQPHKIGHLDRATFSNIEHQGLEFVTDTLMPWIRRMEQAIQSSVLNGSSQFFVEFLVDGLLRGDIKSRYDAYAVAIGNGWMSRNEVRRIENLNPEEGLDGFLVPLNMGESGKKDPNKQEEGELKKSDDRADDRLKALEPIIKHECGRIVRRRTKAIEAKNFNSEKEELMLRQSLQPILETMQKILARSEAIDGILATIGANWDDATKEDEIESVRLKNYKLVISSVMDSLEQGG